LFRANYFVAEDAQHRIIGCGGWTPERPGQGEVQHHIGHIRHFATHPDWIRQGVGRALMTRSKDTARQHAITRFECYSSLSAQDFYAASGFQALRHIDVPLSEACLFPSILMDCPL